MSSTGVLRLVSSGAAHVLCSASGHSSDCQSRKIELMVSSMCSLRTRCQLEDSTRLVLTNFLVAMLRLSRTVAAMKICIWLK